MNQESFWQSIFYILNPLEPTKEVRSHTIPNKNTMERAATMDNPAPDNDASVKSLGIFL